MGKYLIGIIIILSFFLYCSIDLWIETKKEKLRLELNQEALLADVQYYKTESGKNAASVQKLELSKSELEKHYKELTQTAKDLGIKIKRLESASTTITNTEVQITAPVRDSTLIVDNVPVVSKTFDWTDSWVSVSGIIQNNEVACDIQSVDTLTQIVHRVPKKFWFIKWGTKAIQQEIVNKNPHSKIVYTEYIELKK
jgi:hypothetical protein